MSAWVSLVAVAVVVAVGADGKEPVTEIELHLGGHDTREECALASVAIPQPEHMDILTRPGLRSRCLERSRVRGRCFHAQVSVVRDYDLSFLVDVEAEADLGAGPDWVQQDRAARVRSLGERGAILARWPAGSWHDFRVCLGGDEIHRRRIMPPARCALLLDRYEGKPHVARLERPGERGCVVAVNAGREPLVLDVAIPPPAEGETRRHFRFGDGTRFPMCVGRRSVIRQTYGLVGEWEDAWHVGHILVLVGGSKGGCAVGR